MPQCLDNKKVLVKEVRVTEGEIINWHNQESYFLLKDSFDMSEGVKKEILSNKNLFGHIFIASSGTLSKGGRKLIGLSKKALLSSAESVNKHLNITNKDRFLSVLPFYHVSDLGVKARVFLAEAFYISVASFKWSPLNFIKLLSQHKVSISSLVPAQIFDLVKAKVSPPKTVRLILVGGGGLSRDLCYEAFKLGWPLVPTYGMTELCSQVATASLSDLAAIQNLFLNKQVVPAKEKGIKNKILGYVSSWVLLPHVQAKISKGHLYLKSKSLFSEEFTITENRIIQNTIQKKGDWFLTSDKLCLRDQRLSFISRNSRRIKIKSKLVFLEELSTLLNNLNIKHHLYISNIYLLSEEVKREGARLIVVTDSSNFSSSLLDLITLFNGKVQSHEVIQSVYYLKNLPLTSLGKLKVIELKAFLKGDDSLSLF